MSRKSAPPNPETRAADEYFREPETLAPETTEPPAEIEAEEEAPESPAETPEESIEPEEPAAGPIRKIEESRTLRTPLSQDHIKEINDKQIKLEQDLAHEEMHVENNKLLAKNHQKAADTIMGSIRQCIQQLADGHVMQAVPCIKVLDYGLGLATWFRQDTGEQVEERPLNKAEEQMFLEFTSAEEKPEEGPGPEDQGEADEPEEPGEEEVTGALEGQGETQEEAIHV